MLTLHPVSRHTGSTHMTDAEKQTLRDAILTVEKSVKARNSGNPENLSFDLYEIQDFLGDVEVEGDHLVVPDLVG